MRVKIHREGTNTLILLLVALMAVNVPLWYWLRCNLTFIPVVITVASAVFYLFVVNFFRSPRRHFPGNPLNAVVSAADGKVVALEEVMENEYLHCRCIQLSVFMSPANVHANWFPVDGEVIYSKHHSGRFMAAYLPKSSTENERSTVVIRTPSGQDILMRQVAGAMARRIVTYSRKGHKADIDGHLGFIKFGSRVDLYLPLDAEILVEMKQGVRGGVTPVARLGRKKENNNRQ